jgi:hypothetical protein
MRSGSFITKGLERRGGGAIETVEAGTTGAAGCASGVEAPLRPGVTLT